ncbi:MAG: DUF5329 family protein [Candidatus Omnitrophica bacterium]|nr:DUF5329 family protein [Candidatus Omnitrophota bacterium]
MFKVGKLFSGLLLLAILVAYLNACVRLGVKRFPDHEMLRFDDTAVGQTRAYKEYKTLVPGERARISYLLWRMEYSNLNFWRNGATYTGREGAGWLRWKMRKFYPDVRTADEFISRAASRSEKSMVPYRVSCPQYGCFHELSRVLEDELKVLVEFEQEQEKISLAAAETAASPPKAHMLQAPLPAVVTSPIPETTLEASPGIALTTNPNPSPAPTTEGEIKGEISGLDHLVKKVPEKDPAVV